MESLRDRSKTRKCFLAYAQSTTKNERKNLIPAGFPHQEFSLFLKGRNVLR